MPDDFVLVQIRLAETITARDVFTADDVTVDGRFAIDHRHRPLGRQNVIGRVFGWAAGLGLITALDTRPRQSRSPRRKAGGQRAWRRTDTGIAWAITFLEQTPADLQRVADVVEQLALFTDDEGNLA